MRPKASKSREEISRFRAISNADRFCNGKSLQKREVERNDDTREYG
jgi:hypothetical protein